MDGEKSFHHKALIVNSTMDSVKSETEKRMLEHRKMCDNKKRRGGKGIKKKRQSKFAQRVSSGKKRIKRFN